MLILFCNTLSLLLGIDCVAPCIIGVSTFTSLRPSDMANLSLTTSNLISGLAFVGSSIMSRKVVVGSLGMITK